MVSWHQVAVAAPDLARTVEGRFSAHQHHTLATLRRDGSPRISGTEVVVRDGELWLGSMGGARKAQDLRRDPRYALHSHSEDADPDAPTAWPGDAKLAGRAEEIADEAARHRVLGDEVGDAHLFRLEVLEVVTTVVATDGQHLVVTLWTPTGGTQVFQRT